MDERLAAARLLLKVYAGQSLTTALPDVLTGVDEKSHPVVRALSYGCLRYEERLNAILSQLLDKKLKKKDVIVEVLLKVALFECLEEKTAYHAIVNETVKLVARQRNWARGLANACLRRFIREKETILVTANQSPVSEYCLPNWLLGRIKDDWPQNWRMIATASVRQAAMVIRVNLQQTTPTDYLSLLQKKGIEATLHTHCSSAIVLSGATGVNELPGFASGVVSVQGAASQFAAGLLDLADGQRVLDACAAPGGKSLHLLEKADIRLTAIDKQSQRLERITENLHRCNKKATLLAAEAQQLDSWWDGQKFDRILLDAPCSATGVISKHPDIKIHRTIEDVDALVDQQQQLLVSLWETLNPGGRLLYSTCSILREENDRQVRRFINSRTDVSVAPMEVNFAEVSDYGWQILPHITANSVDTDGFYYAALVKKQ